MIRRRTARGRGDAGSRARSDGPWRRRLGVAALILLSAAFSFLNAGERVTVHLGFATLYRISLVGLVFAAFLLGMLTMFLFGLRHDRRVREVLREHATLPPEPFRLEPPREPFREPPEEPLREPPA